jgi:fatty-acid peroxygenase
MPVDDTLGLMLDGYAWLPSRIRRHGGDPLPTRLLGQRAYAVRGPDAVDFFYDERHVRRHTAVPGPVQATLFGRGAVHTLDGEAHRHRKRLFLPLVRDPEEIHRLVGEVERCWDAAAARWPGQTEVELFEESSRVITEAVCGWAAIPLSPNQTAGLAADLVAMVDGFATVGPKHWRARMARARRERWLARLVADVRAGNTVVPAASATGAVARYVDDDGQLLDPRLAAVELLNIIRPTVAVAWFVAFSAHALHRWPRQAHRLRDGGDRYGQAFAHEVRRFYPFAPFVGGRAITDLTWRGQVIPAGSLVLLDIFGQHHDPTLWRQPYEFDPDRFAIQPSLVDQLIPQGGGDPATNHRCPGENLTIGMLTRLSQRLAWLDYTLPGQDLAISLRRIPTRPRSGVICRVKGARTVASLREGAMLSPDTD